MAASASSFAVWNNFFLLAGIPNAVANQYAVTFSQHRMSIDMLKEITKDILIDMGIKAMGDIIAILRHAKNLCTQDELKLGTTKSATHADLSTAKVASVSTHRGNMTTLPERMPIMTTRSSSNTPATVGNKIQSRVSLKSGALMGSSNITLDPTLSSQANQIFVNNNNKKPTSNISESLAKRLRPSAGIHIESTPMETEKTLTVRYPSKSAIARAQLRISSSDSSPIPIKLRLGADKVNHGAAYQTNEPASDSDEDSDHKSNKRGFRTSKGSGFKKNIRSNSSHKAMTRGLQTNKTIRSERHKTDSNRKPQKKLKSTVFHRLGTGPR